jgi:hypothetical protein
LQVGRSILSLVPPRFIKYLRRTVTITACKQ